MSNIASRAIIMYNDHLLVMERKVEGNIYYTLVGGKIADGETSEQGLAREVYEETKLQVTNSRLVYTETNPDPYNSQHIYLCAIIGYENLDILPGSEEDKLNKDGINVHALHWVHVKAFPKLAFRTPQLQTAIVKALEKGFPEEPIAL